MAAKPAPAGDTAPARGVAEPAGAFGLAGPIAGLRFSLELYRRVSRRGETGNGEVTAKVPLKSLTALVRVPVPVPLN